MRFMQTKWRFSPSIFGLFLFLMTTNASAMGTHSLDLSHRTVAVVQENLPLGTAKCVYGPGDSSE